MEVGITIWNTFSFGRFFPLSTDFELIKRFRKTYLRELWSDRLIEILNANSSKPHFGHEVLHGDIQGLYYGPGDLDTLTPQIKEDIEFQNGLVIKLSSGKISCLEN
jgi:hypothetical protein